MKKLEQALSISKELKEKVFRIQAIQTEEEMMYTVAIGNRRATECNFESKEEAEAFIASDPFELQLSLIIALISKEEEHEKTNR